MAKSVANAHTIATSLDLATAALEDAVMNLRLALEGIYRDNDVNAPVIKDVLGTVNLALSTTSVKASDWRGFLEMRKRQ